MIIVGSPFREKSLIFTFDGKIEKNLASMLIVFLDICQQPYVDAKSGKASESQN